MKDNDPKLKEAIEWIEAEYNDAISVFEYSDHIRFTNGSAAMYADIGLSEDGLVLKGERYGERIDKKCERNKESLLDPLRSTF